MHILPWSEIVALTFCGIIDCPQVQCVEQYVAQQADELTMEPADIINVLCKTHEGRWNKQGNILSVQNSYWIVKHLYWKTYSAFRKYLDPLTFPPQNDITAIL